MKLTNIFQMYMGWDINGLADMEHNNRFICGGTYNAVSYTHLTLPTN